MIYISYAEIDHKCTGRAELNAAQKKCGVILRDSLIKKYTGLTDCEIAVSETGKPYIKNHPEVCFNISHSGYFAACALMINEKYRSIGIDVEIIASNVRYDSIAKRYYAAEELENLEKLTSTDERLCEFFTTWTRKESYLKCTGSGLSGGLKSVNTMNSHVLINGVEHQFKTVKLSDSLNNSYMMSVCYPSDEILPDDYSSI